jgi:hypothetical protein
MKQRLRVVQYYSALTSLLRNATGIRVGKEWEGEVMIHGPSLLITRGFLIVVG